FWSGEASGTCRIRTPFANTFTSAPGHVPPTRGGNVTTPTESVNMRIVFAGRFVRYGSLGCGTQSVALSQAQKSSTTLASRTGLFARSRTTTWNGMSPLGHTLMQGGTVELAGEGTAAAVSDAPATSATATKTRVSRWDMRTSWVRPSRSW